MRGRIRSRLPGGSTAAITRSARTGQRQLWIQGGPRARHFPRQPLAPALNKIPLVNWHRSYVYVSSTHMLLPRGLNRVYDEWGGEKASGCLLACQIPRYICREGGRGIEARPALCQQSGVPRLSEAGQRQPDLWCEWSEKYINWRQLEILGLMSKGTGRERWRLGFVMLCHTALDRAAQVARHWAERGCPVVIHVDRRVPRQDMTSFVDLADLGNIGFSALHCDWGTWGIVAATQAASDIMLAFRGPACLSGLGSCLPLRPVEDLKTYLDAPPGRFHRKCDDRGCRLDHRRAGCGAVHAAVSIHGGGSAICLTAMCGCNAGWSTSAACRTGSCRIWAASGGV